jgi:hypothetical protein
MTVRFSPVNSTPAERMHSSLHFFSSVSSYQVPYSMRAQENWRGNCSMPSAKSVGASRLGEYVHCHLPVRRRACIFTMNLRTPVSGGNLFRIARMRSPHSVHHHRSNNDEEAASWRPWDFVIFPACVSQDNTFKERVVIPRGAQTVLTSNGVINQYGNWRDSTSPIRALRVLSGRACLRTLWTQDS